MGRLAADLRYASRVLTRTPAFSLFAVLALAIGIGANTAIFSLIDAILLRPLQFRDPARLVELFEDNSAVGFAHDTPAPANVQDWKTRNHVFEDIAAENDGILNITGGSAAPEEVEHAEITSNLLPLLGIQPILGRNIRADETGSQPAKVVLIGYGIWQRRFGAKPDVIGKTIELDREPFQIVGVMPRGFRFPESIDLWRPSQFRFSGAETLPRTSHFLHVYARLKPGVTAATAQREMSGIAAQLTREYPASNTHLGAVVASLRDQFVGNLQLGLLVLFLGVGALLLIACSNVAGLMLARAAGRRRELAVRAAIGATFGNLIRQSLVESLLLSLAGGGLGTLFAVWSIPLLQKLVPLAMAGWAHPSIDARVLMFTFAVCTLAAIACGVLPALATSQVDLSADLQLGGRAGLLGGSRTRSWLVQTEVALATVLLVGAILLTQTLWNLAQSPLGFQPAHVLTARTSLPFSPQSPYIHFEIRTDFYRQVLERIVRIPGVRAAGYTTFLPLTNRGGTSAFEIEGQPEPKAGEINDANHRVITPDYLPSIGDKLLAGRYFDSHERIGSPPVALINQAMAAKYWPGQQALGKRLRLEHNSPWIQIVGIVDNVRQMGLDLEGRAEMYFPYTQESTAAGYFTPRDLAVRVEGDPNHYTNAIRQAIWNVDPNQPVIQIQPMQALVDDELAARSLQMKLISTFALLALLLAGLGIYGLLAYTVTQRSREFGVRMALGARQSQVLRATLGQGLRLIFNGLAFGFVAAWFLSRAMHNLLYGVTGGGVSAYLVAGVVLLVGGATASYIPARAASRVDPMEALRFE